MIPRSASLVLALLLAAMTAGCTVLDRESYSLIVRKKAHLYDPPAPAAEADLDPEPEPTLPDPATFVRTDLDELIAPLAPRRQAFRPFTYCHVHESSHVLESVVAVALAPAEYPLAMGSHVAYIVADAGLRALMFPFEALFGFPEKPLEFEPGRKPSSD